MSGVADVDAFTEVVAGGSLIFFSSLALSVSGLVFWFVVSRILGVGSVGIVSSLVSAAGLATAFMSAGLPVASLREFAARGLSVLRPALVVSVVVAFASALLAYFLSLRLAGVGRFAWFPVLMAFLSVATVPLVQSLIGLGVFKNYFNVTLTASVLKVLVGTAPLLVVRALAVPLAGYLSYPLVAGVLAAYYLLRMGGGFAGGNDVGFAESVKSLVKLTFSNYPFILSSQVLTLLSVYGFAVATGRMFGTGVLYLSLMIVVVLSSVTGSLLTASLSVGVRRGYDPFTNALRVGLGLTAPVAVTVSTAPAIYLAILNPQLVRGALTLSVLALSIPPSLTISAAIMKLNKQNRQRELTAIGLVRLLTLIAGLLIAMRYGTVGVAAAYLASNIAPLPLAVKEIPNSLRYLTIYWLTQAGLTAVALKLIPSGTIPQEIAVAAVAAVIALAVEHVTKTFRVREVGQTVRSVIKAIRAT